MPSILLVDGFLGSASVRPLADGMTRSRVSCFEPTAPNWSVSTYRRALEELLAGGEHWDLVVGFDWSAAIAAQLALRGRCGRAILLDPTINVAGLEKIPGMLEALRSALSPIDSEVFKRMGPSIMDIMIQPVDDATIDQAFGVFSGDPGRVRRAELYKQQQRRWGSLHGRDPVAAPEDVSAVNWLASVEKNQAHIEVWWSHPYAAAVAALSGYWPHGRFIAQPWPELAWLAGDRRVAEALEARAYDDCTGEN